MTAFLRGGVAERGLCPCSLTGELFFFFLVFAHEVRRLGSGEGQGRKECID